LSAEDLAWAIEDVRSRLAPYALRVAYDKGDHRLLFATEKYRNTFGDLFREFADNLCDDVVDALTDRLQINGWTAKDDTPTEGDGPRPTNTLGLAVDRFWERTKGAARAGAIHRNAIREGDGFAIVQEDREGAAHIWKQRPEQMAVRYSTENPDQVDLAAKVWRSGKRYRATLYYPDGRKERWGTRGVGTNGGLPQARAFTILTAGDPDLKALELDNGITEGDDTGMPVFHFPNGEVSEYGQSVVAKVIPLQDALNKSVTDMLVAMEFHAYPQRWATGVEVEYDAQGNERQPFQAGEGRVWRVGSREAQFGEFATGDLQGFLKVQDGFRLEIARKGALPPHAVNLRSEGGAPTGISLLVAEGRTIKWAKDRQRDWGSIHREMVAYALNLELPGAGVTSEDLDLDWAPPETRDMKALLEELALKKDLGVPLKQLLQEAGYDLEKVLEFLGELDAEGEAAAIARETLSGGRTSRITQGDAIGLQQGLQPGADGAAA
jgi:hypothetical protein